MSAMPTISGALQFPCCSVSTPSSGHNSPSFLSLMCYSNFSCFLGDHPWRFLGLLKSSQHCATFEVSLDIIGFSFQFYPTMDV